MVCIVDRLRQKAAIDRSSVDEECLPLTIAFENSRLRQVASDRHAVLRLVDRHDLCSDLRTVETADRIEQLIRTGCRYEHLLIRDQLERDLWMRQRQLRYDIADIRCFCLWLLEELFTRRRIEEQIFYSDRRTESASCIFCTEKRTAFNDELCSERIALLACLKRELRHSTDGGKCLTAKAERQHLCQIVCRADLARCMTKHGKLCIFARHPLAVVADTDHLLTAAVCFDRDLCRACIDRILDKFLDDRGRAFHDLACRYFIDRLFIQ